VTTAGLSRHLEALRAARPRQLAARPRRLLPPAALAVGLGAEPQEIRPLAAGLGADPAPQGGPCPPPHETGTFRGYGFERRLDADDPNDPLILRFAVHGFGPLASYAGGRRSPDADRFWADAVRRWLERHRQPRLPAWHPYPTSSRIIAWTSALSTLSWPDSLRADVAAQLGRQARYLRRCVEHDVGGNHVMRNATALAFAGAVLPRTGLLPLGLELLRREASEQVLPDGGHLERSPSYHREVLGDLRDVRELVARTGARPPGWLDDAIGRAEAWQAALAGPDGRLPLLNDAWDGPPVARSDADNLHLADSGHVALRHERDQAVLDVGPLCPAHLPPHAHADALSFVLWADGQPVVVDPGSFSYSGPERDRFRGTAAHATVAVDGADQCVFLGDFRAVGLPEVRALAPRAVDGAVVVDAVHDGYRRLADPVVHRRTFAWVPGAGLVVVDRLDCAREHPVSLRLPLAPGIPASAERAGPFAVRALGGTVETADGWHSPWLGERVRTTDLRIRRTASPGEPFGWSLLREPWRVRELDARRLAIAGPGGTEVRVDLRDA
jgi:hypothetical protein